MGGTTLALQSPSDVVGSEYGPRDLSRPQSSFRFPRPKSGRSFILALAISAGVPLGAVLSVWSNLTEPFWFNEQWRAYYVGLPNHWWSALRTDGAPFPAGWYFLERASGYLFGNTELTLRLPTALFLPVTSVLLLLLSKRWMPLAGAVVVSLIGSMTAAIVGYAVQLSEYQIDAAAAVAVILLHEIGTTASSADWRYKRVYWAYAGIAVACIFGTPSIFLAGPLLMLDALKAFRRRAITPNLVAAVGSGFLILVHLVFFVIRQNAITKSTYWDPQFLPHRGIGRQISFVFDGLKGFLLEVFTHSPHSSVPALLSSRWSWILSVCFGVCVTLAGCGFAAAYEISGYGQLRGSADNIAYGNAIGNAVDKVKAEARPGDALVVAGFMAIQGWQFYQNEYTGKSIRRDEPLPDNHVLYISDHGAPTITRMVRSVRPPRVFVYIPYGTTPQEFDMDSRAINAAQREWFLDHPQLSGPKSVSD